MNMRGDGRKVERPPWVYTFCTCFVPCSDSASPDNFNSLFLLFIHTPTVSPISYHRSAIVFKGYFLRTGSARDLTYTQQHTHHFIHAHMYTDFQAGMQSGI